MTSEIMKYDLVIVGGGPSGLSSAIRFKQLCQENNKDFSVCLIEKSSEIGSHILSGAVLEPKALNELFPNWLDDPECPVKTKVSEEKLLYLSENKSYEIPKIFIPSVMHNDNNFIISLGNFCKWLASKAEGLGVEIYPGFSVSSILKNESSTVCGIKTGDNGILKDGSKGPNFQPGIEIHSKYLLLAEGCRGHLGKNTISEYSLDKNCQHQTYGIGLKELWQVKDESSYPGFVQHTIGWPLTDDIYGGSFMYHLDTNLVSLGMVIGLDYQNPYVSPYEEFQRFKTHPTIKNILKRGKRISYGARALNEGGWQSLPKLIFPGGALIGCEAGTLNTPKIKGTHTAMKSGMIASESVFVSLSKNNENNLLESYEENFYKSWAGQELKSARNVRPAFKWGLKKGMIATGIDQILLRGKAPWTISHHKPDHDCLVNKNDAVKIDYPKHDGVITFDRLTNLSFSSTYHEENQPCHLKLSNSETPINYNLKVFDSPEQRYCPAGVYEVLKDDNQNEYLQINAQNCIHCKTCDIKDPTQNINWIVPEGGGGPNYSNM